jgi:hypothetical protein
MSIPGSRQEILLTASYVFSFCFPESITKTTSSMVMDDSAMLVAITTFRLPLPAGGRSKIPRCRGVCVSVWTMCECGP